LIFYVIFDGNVVLMVVLQCYYWWKRNDFC